MSVNVTYGSDGGATEGAASRIAERAQGRTIDIENATRADFESCALLILGSPTYGNGDLQADREAHLGKPREANLAGRRVALFGTGDQETYPESFVDAMGILYDIVVGFTEVDGCSHIASLAERGGRFVGPALDPDTRSSKTNPRIEAWIAGLI